jgi:transcription factor WhiB
LNTTATATRMQLLVHNWTLDAKCAALGSAGSGELRDLLFPAPRDNKKIAMAKRFCENCPVALACLADGISDIHAVRAGLTADERRRLREGSPVEACGKCGLAYVPRPSNPTECTGCTGRMQRQVVPEDYKEQIIAMHNAGASGEEICLHFGFSRDEVRLAGKRWKIGLMRRAKSECGTPNGARAHYRNGEPRCQPCIEADRVYRAERARKAEQLVAA